MTLKKLLFFLLIIVTSCSQRHKGNTQSVTDSTKKEPRDPGPMTKEYKDVDTLIYISLFNLKTFETNIERSQKKRIVINAANSTLGEFASRWTERGCWKYDSSTNKIYADTLTDAPDCRLNDFHFMDIDNDGDLDILYSSLVDQYAQSDTNEFILLQNNNGKYVKFGIGGYLYEADFSNKAKGIITFKTVSAPCCLYSYYNFSETTFYTKTWSFQTKHVLEISKSRVKERY